MIIPNYNDSTISVYIDLNEEELNLSKEEIAGKAFSYITGLESMGTIDAIAFSGVKYPFFKTESLNRIYVACENSDISDNCQVSSVVYLDKECSKAFVLFRWAVIGRFCSEEDIIPMIDFLYQYKDELITNKSGIII